MKRTIFTLACVLGSSLTSSYAADSLIDVLRLAFKHDPQYQAAVARHEATKERTNQTFAAFLPQLSASANLSRSATENTGFINQAQGLPPDKITTESTNYSVNLRQSIYDHSIWLNHAQAKRNVTQDALLLEAEKQNVMVRTTESYLNVLAAQDSLTFAKAETKAIGQQLEQTKQRFNVGLIAITDVHEAQADYDRAVANEILAQNTLDNAREALREITGRYHGELFVLSNRMELQKPTPSNIDEWVKQAQEKNLNFQAQKVALEIARKNIKVRQAGHLPSLGLSASWSDNSRENEDGILLSATTGTTIGIGFEIPLFQGGSVYSQTEEARHLFDQSAQNLELAYRQAQRSTRSAYLGLIAGISSVKALSQSLVSNESALEATQAGFEVGTRTIVDVLLSTRALFRAKSDLSNAKFEYLTNILRLKQAAGTLAEADVAKINSWLNSPKK